MNRNPKVPATTDAEVMRRLEELRDKMAADILAAPPELDR